MAGRGSRFIDGGYTVPKPMIKVYKKPMIQVVVENLTPNRPHRFIFICQNEHIKEYKLDTFLKGLAEDVEIIGIDGITEGMVCTVLKAKHLINNGEPLMTANSDQYIDFDINLYLEEMDRNDADGLIMTMKSSDTKWSFARTDKDGVVVETAEKKVISKNATVGIYNFSQGSFFVKSAEEMIAEDVRVNGEFYVCPCYNYMIRDGKKVVIYGIGEEYNGMYGLGIPKDLELFLANPVSQKTI
ncbi:MAG: glycosyltransferase family 2 protein [Alphaproteobacteria bacterium]|nr:glycosyltransferase family 2 protein [Alphaproteobacteria bacterium]MBL0718254.1 glycosyltransferase family 2 protein [Alphaproteobacteria bacterium]